MSSPRWHLLPSPHCCFRSLTSPCSGGSRGGCIDAIGSSGCNGPKGGSFIASDVDPLFTKASPSTVAEWLSHNAITSILNRQYFIGVDLGQRRDRTTIVIIEVADIASNQRNAVIYAPDRRTRRAVCHMERLPLDTPYTAIVERLTRLANELAASNPCTVVVDATGVGLPVVDALWTPVARLRLMPVTIGHSERDT